VRGGWCIRKLLREAVCHRVLNKGGKRRKEKAVGGGGGRFLKWGNGVLSRRPPPAARVRVGFHAGRLWKEKKEPRSGKERLEE